jgi:outer membrane protein OmpA-like peptidoglycan-associated protein
MNRLLRALLGSSLLATGCATVAPPPELLEARSTYSRVAQGPAASVKPDDLLTAKQQLDRAESTFKDKGNDPVTRDAAYIAVRKALFAEADANTIVNLKAKADAEQKAQQMQAADLSAAKGQLSDTRGQLAHTQQELDQERVAREAAEKRAAAALADLQKIAAVKKDDRGMIITLQGGVLFKTDKYELLPAAMAQLNQVAEALLRNNRDARMVVGGYTDSQGPEPHNQELSENRAKSVADYLVSRGIARDRITSKGFGSQNPISDNTSVEGRAQNRRVEIVVDNALTPAK